LLAGLLDEDAWLAGEYLVGSTAAEREARQLGSGEFLLAGSPGEGLVAAPLDGTAVFTLDPASFVEELR
jgi:hypothetical protein